MCAGGTARAAVPSATMRKVNVPTPMSAMKMERKVDVQAEKSKQTEHKSQHEAN